MRLDPHLRFLTKPISKKFDRSLFKKGEKGKKVTFDDAAIKKLQEQYLATSEEWEIMN